MNLRDLIDFRLIPNPFAALGGDFMSPQRGDMARDCEMVLGDMRLALSGLTAPTKSDRDDPPGN